jgi:putative ATPase
LRPASTKGGRQAGWGEGYAYAHDHEGGVAPGQYFLPEAIRHERIYVPSNQGEEPRVAKRLEEARARREGRQE